MTEAVRRIDAREASVGKALLQAMRTLSPLMQDLPTSEVYLLHASAVEAWRVLRDEDPDQLLVLLGQVRLKCGNAVAQMVLGCVGAPSRRARREIAVLTPAEVRDRPPALDLVRDIFPGAGIAACIGPPGCGKSFLMFSLACAVSLATGRWFGRRCGAGASLYIGTEGTMGRRAQAYERAHHLTLDDAALRIIEQPLDLLHPEADIDQLLERIALAQDDLGPMALTVIDTLNRTMPGGKENSPEDMGLYTSHVARIAAATGGLVVIIHHTGKNEAAGGRGHSSLLGALDCEVMVTTDPTGARSFTTSKQRDGAEGIGMAFQLDVVDLGPHPHPQADEDERLSSCVVVPFDGAGGAAPRQQKLTADERIALNALKEELGQTGHKMPATSTLPGRTQCVTVEAWRVRFYARLGDERDATKQDTKRKAFERGLKGLVAKSIAGVWEKYAWVW